MTDPAAERSNAAPEPADESEPAHEVERILPAGPMLLLGLQHVLAMYAGAVAVPLLVGSALGLSKSQQAFLINADLFTCGIATLLQALGLGRHLGIRLPVLLGVSFTAVGPMIAIGKNLGIQYVYGAILCSGLLVVLLCGQVSRLRRFFPPVVTGSIVTIIGTSLLPVAMHWAAGGIGAPDYGSRRHLLLAALVLVTITLVHRFGRGFVAAIAVLIGLVTGSIAALALGQMSLTGVTTEPWLAVTTPFWFGRPRFDAAAILTMSLVAVVCMVESMGVFFAIGKMVRREIRAEDLSRGLRAEGVAMVLGGCLNSFPYSTYGQNAGLVALTRVHSRYVVAVSGVILLVLGLFPRFAALVASIPPSVLGGAGIVMFGMVAAAGVRMLSQVDFERSHNLFVIAVSLGLGLGVSVVPQITAALPGSIRWICSDGIVLGSLTALGLNALGEIRKERPATS